MAFDKFYFDDFDSYYLYREISFDLHKVEFINSLIILGPVIK